MNDLIIFDKKGYSTKNIEKIVKNDIIILNCFKKLKQIEEISGYGNKTLIFIIYDYSDIFECLANINKNRKIIFATHNHYLVNLFKTHTASTKFINLNNINDILKIIR